MVVVAKSHTHTQTCPISFFFFLYDPFLPPLSHLICSCKNLFFTIELAQSSLDLLVILLHFRQGILNVLQRDLLIWLLGATGFILAGAVVLDLFARFLDLAQAQCCRGSFQEVAQLGEFGEFFFFPASLLGNKNNNIQCSYADDLQRFLNLAECALGLLEKSVDDFLAEIAIVVVVHFQNLFKGRVVDAVGHFGKVRSGLLGLGQLVSCLGSMACV